MRPTTRQNDGDFTPRSITPARLHRPALTLHRGGLARRVSPQQQLDQDVRDAAIACKRTEPNTSSAYPTRAVADLAQGSRFAARVLGRIITQALIGGGPYEFGERIGHALLALNARVAAEVGCKPVAQDDERKVAA